MNSKEFLKLFDTIARSNGFEKAFGGWFKDSTECIVLLDLQKSKFGEYFELNIKIFVQGLFGKKYIKGKDLVKKLVGNIFFRPPDDYKRILDIELMMDDNLRHQGLENLFRDFINPITDKTMSKKGLIELESENILYLLPAVKEELLNFIS